MSEEVQNAAPAEPVEAEQANQVESTSSEATAEQTQEQASQQSEEEAEKARKGPPKWAAQRFSELATQRNQANERAEHAAREAQALRDQLARFQSGDTSQARDVDVQTLAQQEAARIVAEQRFNESCNKVYAEGAKEFKGDFDAALRNLQMVGVNREFLELASTSDAGHKVLHHLGSDLDEAARILSLPPVQMARELTKLEIKLSQSAVKPVSNAPAPITPIAGVNGGTKDPSEMTDAEFAKWRKAQIAQRR